MSFSRIAIFVVITAVAVYLGLTLILPHTKIEPTLASGPTADEVFNSNTTATPAASSTAAAPADTSGAPAPSQADAAVAAPTAEATPAPPPSAEAPKPSAPSAADTASSNEPAAAESAAPATATTSSNGDGKSLTEAEARKIAEDVGRKVATQVAQQLIQQQAVKQAPADAGTEPAVSDDEVRRIAQTEVQKAVNAKSSNGAAASTAEPRPAPAPPKALKSKPAKTAPVKSVAAQASGSTVSSTKKANGAQADAIAAWWAPASQPGSGRLGLSFAGEAAAERAIALLFTAPFSDAAAAGSHIKVLNASGKPVSGQWMLAPNPRMLVLRVATRGRYTVLVGADVADSQGNTLGSALHGPVYVH
ncbi:MAG: hypothetical protein JWR16_2352 [Nevskia sp.]|nr:hypothetical protein [Nevskia sp.]